MMTVIAVAAGGALGATLRYLAYLVVAAPLGTLIVNVAGGFAMGLAVALLIGAERFDSLAPFLLTGVLGGFTTFSAFSIDALRLVETGRIGAAGGYVVGSVGLSLLACWAGLWLGQYLIQYLGRPA